MPAAKKTKIKKKAVKTTTKKTDGEKPVRENLIVKIRKVFTGRYKTVVRRIKELHARRPHRSFRRTRRRDYVRPLNLPGYWAFTASVGRILLQNRRLFFGLAAVYAILIILLVGLASQDIYTDLSDTIRETSSEVFGGDIGSLGETGLLLVGVLGGSFNVAPTDLQRTYAIILGLLIWLTTVWLLRVLLAGRKPKLRDGLYNASAPFLSIFLVGLLLVVQLLPIALAVLAFGAATASRLLEGGIEAMVFWAGASLLTALSLYWISSTFIAMVVVTLPGMYPMQAIRTAGDLVIGRRVRILLRLIWLMVTALVIWALVMIPVILLDMWAKGMWPIIEWIPVIPVALLCMSSLTVIWSSSYVYLLYRKVVDDDAAPA